MLAELRTLDGLTERSRGVFYRRSRAYLHFHQDPTGFFADVRLGGGDDFERRPVTTARQQAQLLTLVRRDLAQGAPGQPARNRSAKAPSSS
jgi:hypothetical protein